MGWDKRHIARWYVLANANSLLWIICLAFNPLTSGKLKTRLSKQGPELVEPATIQYTARRKKTSENAISMSAFLIVGRVKKLRLVRLGFPLWLRSGHKEKACQPRR